MTTTTTHMAGRLANGDRARSKSVHMATGSYGVGGRAHHGPGAARHHRLHARGARFATNPATQIPRERIEQYSRFRSTASINQAANCRESDNVELRILPTTFVPRPRAQGSNLTSSDIRLSQPPGIMKAARSASLLTAEQRMAGAVDPLSTPPQSSVGSGRRLSSTLARTGTRHSDRTGRRLSTTSNATTHSWHGNSGLLASLPTPGLLASLAGAAHYTGNPKYSTQEAVRASFGCKTVVLEDKRKQTVEDVLELFCAHPSLEIFDRSWHRDAVFEDPWTKCVGFKEYSAQWFGLPKLASKSTTIQYRVLSSTHTPHRIVFDQTQQYTLRYIKRKKTVRSLIILELDEDGKIIRMEDRWNGEELPRKWGAMWFRRFNGKVIPLFVRVPRPAPERTPTPV